MSIAPTGTTLPQTASIPGLNTTSTSGLCKICSWIAGELKMVEQLSADWQSKGTAGSQVTWITIIKDIAHIFMGIISAIAVIIPTLGGALPCLINEASKLTKRDAANKANAALQNQANVHTKAMNDQQAKFTALSTENANLQQTIQDQASKHKILQQNYDNLKTEHEHHKSLFSTLNPLHRDSKTKETKEEKKERKRLEAEAKTIAKKLSDQTKVPTASK